MKETLPEQQTAKKSKSDFVLITVILLFALALRVWQINARGLWFDEAYEFWASVVPVRHIFKVVSHSLQPPLYNILLHFWMKAGHSETWLRLLSVLLDLLGILATLLLCLRAFNRKTVLIVGLNLALMPVLIRYSQEVGEYALWLCCLQWLCYFMYQAYHEGKWKHWLLLSLSSLLAWYSHYGAFVPIAAAYLVLFVMLILKKDRSAYKKLFTSASLTAIGALVVLPTFLAQIKAIGNKAQWSGAQALTLARDIAKGFLNSLNFMYTGYPFTRITQWIPWIVFMVLILLGVWVWVRQGKKGLYYPLLLGLSFVVYAILIIPGFYGHGSFGFRYGLVLLPAFILFLGNIIYELTQEKNRIKNILALVLTIALLSLSAYSLPNRGLSEKTRGKTDWPETNDLRDVMAQWQETRTEDSFTIITFGEIQSFGYNLTRLGMADVDDFAPNWVNACLGNLASEDCKNERYVYEHWSGGVPLEERFDVLSAAIPQGKQEVWMVYSRMNETDIEQWEDWMTDLGYAQTLALWDRQLRMHRYEIKSVP